MACGCGMFPCCCGGSTGSTGGTGSTGCVCAPGAPFGWRKVGPVPFGPGPFGPRGPGGAFSSNNNNNNNNNNNSSNNANHQMASMLNGLMGLGNGLLGGYYNGFGGPFGGFGGFPGGFPPPGPFAPPPPPPPGPVCGYPIDGCWGFPPPDPCGCNITGCTGAWNCTGPTGGVCNGVCWKKFKIVSPNGAEQCFPVAVPWWCCDSTGTTGPAGPTGPTGPVQPIAEGTPDEAPPLAAAPAAPTGCLSASQLLMQRSMLANPPRDFSYDARLKSVPVELEPYPGDDDPEAGELVAVLPE